MAQPPSYDEVAGEKLEIWDKNTGTLQRLTIRDEVGVSRSEHVATLVSRVLPQIRERARCGLSKTAMLLMPSDQSGMSKNGQLVGFPETDQPILVQLEGRYDGTEFWTQQEALDLLRNQMLFEIAGDLSAPLVAKLSPDEKPAPQLGTSFWGRKHSKKPQARIPAAEPAIPPPVSVEVQLEHVNFRTETNYGLYETIRGRGVLMVVEVR